MSILILLGAFIMFYIFQQANKATINYWAANRGHELNYINERFDNVRIKPPKYLIWRGYIINTVGIITIIILIYLGCTHKI
jgi:hypothetical protein